MRPSGPPSDRPRSSRTGPSGSKRGDRPQSRDRGDRPDRGERPPYRGDRPDRGERPPYRGDRPDRGERPQNRDRSDRPERSERPPYRGDRPDRGDRPPYRGDRPDRGDRPQNRDRGDRPERSERPPYRGDRPERSERPPYRGDRPDRGDRPQNRDRGDRPERSERPPYRGDRPERGDRPQNRDRGDRPPYRGGRPNRGERPQRDASRPRSGARYVSHALLFHVIKEKVTLDEAIDRSRAFAQLEDRDRRFVRQLVTTCLRRLGQLQLVLRDYLEEPLPPKNLNVKVLLLMGIAEHHFMRSPSHALVSEAVSLARSDEMMRNYQGLVNAVLRKVCDRDKDELPHLRHNIPRWLAKRWYAVYGDAWLDDLSHAITQAPPTDLGVKPGAELPIISPEEAQVLADAEEERYQAARRAEVAEEAVLADEMAAEATADPGTQEATDTALADGQSPADAPEEAAEEPAEELTEEPAGEPTEAPAEDPAPQPDAAATEQPAAEQPVSDEPARRPRAEYNPRPRAEHIVATRLPNAALRLAPSQGSIAQLPGYEEGDWWVQDAAAQVPVMMLGDVAGKRVLDLCAAPGGKTLQLAAQGADVTAVDISENRLQRLHENLERCKLTANVIAQDALTFEDEHGFDAILLDAPCSATGTLRRHPELLWQRKEDSLLTHRRLQAKLLGRAVRLLKPDGVLVYAVCSLEPEEGIEQVKAALAALPLAISAMPSTPDWLTPLLTTEGFFRSAPQSWSQYGGMDGFFAARLQRRTVDKPKAATPVQPSAGRLRLAQN